MNAKGGFFTLTGTDFAAAERAAERSLRAAAYHMAAADAMLVGQQRARSASLVLEDGGAQRSAARESPRLRSACLRSIVVVSPAEPLGVPKPAEDWSSKTHQPRVVDDLLLQTRDERTGLRRIAFEDPASFSTPGR